jgi:hypothetical protein
MRASLQCYAEKSIDVKRCAVGLLLERQIVAEKKVLNGRSQWFSHVR